MKSQIQTNINNLKLLVSDSNLQGNIEKSITEISRALSQGLPLLVFGNGGSASDALHITGELVGKFNANRKSLNVICLNSNVTVITAWANDFSFNTIYARQIEAYGVKKGVCLGISTSGNSKSVVSGIKQAKKMGMITIALTGSSGGALKNCVDILINVPSNVTPRIQEMHLPVYHYICEKIEHNLIDF
jgi:D-sedoheptulose 7-phosphate isomerase